MPLIFDTDRDTITEVVDIIDDKRRGPRLELGRLSPIEHNVTHYPETMARIAKLRNVPTAEAFRNLAEVAARDNPGLDADEVFDTIRKPLDKLVEHTFQQLFGSQDMFDAMHRVKFALRVTQPPRQTLAELFDEIERDKDALDAEKGR